MDIIGGVVASRQTRRVGTAESMAYAEQARRAWLVEMQGRMPPESDAGRAATTHLRKAYASRVPASRPFVQEVSTSSDAAD